MEYDSVTGVYYDRARYYDPATGRFVGQDPKGFTADDFNLYISTVSATF
jgi:RHS repeat-associated protein